MTTLRTDAAGTAGTSSVPLFDISRQHQVLETEIQAALTRVCRSGKFVLGPECVEFEAAMARYCGVRHAVACASGSDALLLSLMAYDIGPGDEVLCPSYTFFATASAVTRLGAKPVFVDIDPESCNLNPGHAASLVTPRTRAIIPVHLYGQCAEMESILYLGRKYELPIIEDACQAIGARYRGRTAGSLGNIGCFSFYPTKNLGCYGDGGMMTTDDPAIADKLRLLRGHGMQPRYYHQIVGINSRLDTMQAAILQLKLPRLDAWTKARSERAARYDRWFCEAGLDSFIRLPSEQVNRAHVWNQYVVHVADGRRDDLRAYLTSKRIGTEVYYPVPLHLQDCFRYLGYGEGSLPQTERAAKETLALPIFPELTVDEQRLVVDEITNYFAVQATSTVHAGKMQAA